jgi:hypothetical protein
MVGKICFNSAIISRTDIRTSALEPAVTTRFAWRTHISAYQKPHLADKTCASGGHTLCGGGDCARADAVKDCPNRCRKTRFSKKPLSAAFPEGHNANYRFALAAR